MRLFIAALIPDSIKNKLYNYIHSLRNNIDGVKWEKPEKLHVTLKFLGDVEEAKVQDISTLLEFLVKEYSPFKINLLEFGGFPNLNNPRVLYVGLSQNKELSRFNGQLDDALSKIGFKKENRRFIPHITIGRVKKRISIKEAPGISTTPFEITQVGIIKSELTSEGSAYTPLRVFNLDE